MSSEQFRKNVQFLNDETLKAFSEVCIAKIHEGQNAIDAITETREQMSAMISVMLLNISSEGREKWQN